MFKNNGCLACVMVLVIGGVGGTSSVAGAQNMPEGAVAKADLERTEPSVYDALLEKRAVPETLTRERLARGFMSVSRSTEQCVERHVKGGGEFPTDSVRVVVTIQGNGRVSRMELDWELTRTVFGKCMTAHSSRWLFDAFAGSPIKVGKTFRLLGPQKDNDADLY